MRSLVQLLLGATAVLAAGAVALAQAPVAAQSVLSGAPTPYMPSVLGPADSSALSAAVRAVRSGDRAAADAYRLQLNDATAQKLVRWLQADQLGSSLSFLELDAARRDLAGWPRAITRQSAGERAMETALLQPDQVIAWFDGAPPHTANGAMALAGALQAKGRDAQARELIKSWWRERLFEVDVQARMLGRFGAYLDRDDHLQRMRTLLLGPQGPATSAMLAFVSPDEQLMAQAVMAMRVDAVDASARFAAVPASVAGDPALAFERARYLRRKSLESLGFGLLANFPRATPDDDTQDRIWLERRNYFNAALRARNWRAAYAAMNNHGFSGGERLVEAEFFAGWTALKKLNDPASADRHFEILQKASSTPITQGRAAYWRGQAAEARGDKTAAQAFYKAGAGYLTSFYGQLAAEKAGIKTLVLPKDPSPTAADRQRFDGRETVRAARMLADIGERDLFRTFVMAVDDTLPTAEELVLLIDVARAYGDQDLAMRVARSGAQRNFVLPERGYPVVSIPAAPGSVEPAFALSIARQESNFHPGARSSVGARGMMQLMPATARGVARRLGEPYDDSRLWEADYNLRLGAYHLGELVSQFGGSYVMAAAGYNAGPRRPPQWASECGDPRGGTTDPLDFVECIPFSETRNYVMRTLETTQVYRARLNGGVAPLTLSSDLKRGGYGAGYVPSGPVPYQPSATITTFERSAPNATP